MTGNWLHIGADADGAVANPVAPWAFQTPSILIWILLAIFFIRQTRRDGRFSVHALIFLSATSMFWLEFPADWGAYLVYSPAFRLIPLELPFTTPNKPAFMPAAYGWYFLAIYAFLIWLVNVLMRARPRMARITAVILVAAPFFYLWDLLVEGFAALVGWWTYVEVYGAYWKFARGTMPLLFPIIPFTVYGILATAVLTWRDDRGMHRLERLTGAPLATPGWGREARRLLAWIIAMNLMFGAFALAMVLFRIAVS